MKNNEGRTIVVLDDKALNAGIMNACMDQANIAFTLKCTAGDIAHMSKHKSLEEMTWFDLNVSKSQLSYSCERVILTIGAKSRVIKSRYPEEDEKPKTNFINAYKQLCEEFNLFIYPVAGGALDVLDIEEEKDIFEDTTEILIESVEGK